MPRKSREAEIKQVAARLFAIKGYRQTSMADIATELSMLKGSLYNYVASKQELAIKVLEDFAKELLSDIRKIAESDLNCTEKIRRLFQQHVSYLIKNPYISMVFLEERLDDFTNSKKNTLNKKRIEYQEQWSQIVSEGITSGEFRQDLNLNLAVSILQGICNWMISCKRLRNQLPDSQMTDAFVDIALRGLVNS